MRTGRDLEVAVGEEKIGLRADLCPGRSPKNTTIPVEKESRYDIFTDQETQSQVLPRRRP